MILTRVHLTKKGASALTPVVRKSHGLFSFCPTLTTKTISAYED
jgi:hypothetical protein